MDSAARPGIVRKIREAVRQRFGFIPVLELRNKILLGPRVPGVYLRESREVARLRKRLGAQTPSATVACIVPTYRRHDRLVTAVESILKQTYSDFVVMVVDDGGGLPELPKDPRVFALSLSRNVGIAGVVRNVGIRLSNSKYIAFLDDDNTWTPEHLALCLEALETGKDLVYTAIARRTASGRELDVISAPFDRRTLINDAYVDTSAMVVRRSDHVRFSRIPRGRTTLPGEDWEIVYRLSRHAKVAHIPTVTVDYLVNPESFFTPWEKEATE